MKCPCLAGNYMYSCAARKEVYIPTSFEYAEYCNSERNDLYKVCSHYGSSPQNAGTKQSGDSPSKPELLTVPRAPAPVDPLN
jgi:hypothetical protein